MRIFKNYSPKLVAKHVKVFFKGNVYITGRGGYTFEHGKLVLPSNPDKIHEETVREVNMKISELIC